MLNIFENEKFLQSQRARHIATIEKISDKVSYILDRMTEQDLIHFAYFCNEYPTGVDRDTHDVSYTGELLSPALIKAAQHELNRRLPGMDFSIIFQKGENK